MFPHVIDLSNYQIIEPEFSWLIVGLSISFAIVATYTALSLNERSKNYSFLKRNTWIIATSLAFAYGIWSMHYMGMIAYLFPVKVTYHLGLTIVSIIPILITSYLAFYLINQNQITMKKALVFSLFMSLGVLVMHNIGMHAMETTLMHKMDYRGIIFAYLTSFVGFFILCSFYQHLHKIKFRLLMSFVIGLFVSGTHYIAKLSMVFYIEKGEVLPSSINFSQNRIFVAAFLTLGLVMMAIILVSWTIYDYYIIGKTKEVDAVTHLPNSYQFNKNIQNKKYKQMAALTFEDLSSINRSFGYHIGDAYLQHMTDIIKKWINQSVDVYRLTPNQFILATERNDQGFSEQLEAISNNLQEPFEHGYISYNVTGVCAYVSTKLTNEPLIDCINAIMRCTKLPKDFSLIIYNKEHHSIDLQYEILKSINKAMETGELFLVYQPKIDSKTGRIVGAEALLRWHHSELGFLNPAEFIPILEANQKMGEVTNWVIREVCKQLKRWNESNFILPHASVNIPGEYLSSPMLMKSILASTKAFHIQPHQLELEITETTFVGNLEKGMRTVNMFRQHGFSVALDDFGTGLSSLSYLRQMQINTLKIDKSFVDNIPYIEKDTAIFLAILSLGQSLNLNVVVEGVETEEQVQFINSYCDRPIIQGYYFSKPLTVQQFEETYFKKETVPLK